MTTWQLKTMTLWELIKAYGQECNYGGMGYTRDDSDELLTEIKVRLDKMGEVTGNV